MLRVAHSNMLADIYIQKYPGSFSSSKLIDIKDRPSYSNDYQPELVYRGNGAGQGLRGSVRCSPCRGSRRADAPALQPGGGGGGGGGGRGRADGGRPLGPAGASVTSEAAQSPADRSARPPARSVPS